MSELTESGAASGSPVDDDAGDMLDTGVVIAGPDGLIGEADETVAAMLGYGVDELVGAPLVQLIPERFHEQHTVGFGRWSETGTMRLGGQPLALVARHRSGFDVPVTVSLHHIERAGGREVVAFLNPERSHPTHHSELSGRVLALIGRELPLDELLAGMIAELTDQLGWDHGLAWLPDDSDGELRLAASWSRDDDGFAVESSDRTFAPGAGQVGSSFASSEAVWVEDLASLAHYHRADLAQRHGVTSAIFFPLVAGDERVAAIELVSRRPRGIDVPTNHALELLSSELGALIRQRRDMERSEAQRRRLDLAVEAAELGTWTLDLARDRVEGSAQLAVLYGLEADGFDESFDDFVGRVHRDHRDEFRQRLVQAGRDGQRFDHLYPIVRPDGESVWLRGAGQGLHDADGRLRSITGIAFDVTDSIEYATVQEERIRHADLVAAVGQMLTRDWLSDTVLQQVAQAVVDHVDAAFARIWTIDDGASELTLRASAGMYTHLDGDHARIPVGQYKIGRIAQLRKPHLTNNVIGDPEVSNPEWAEREGMVAFAGYPLLVSGECTGVLGLFAKQELGSSALDLIGTVADMVALADARYRLYRQRAEVADVLQRSLIPPDLPVIPGVEIGVAYQPSVGEVSGDFYDVFAVRDDAWAVMIGDVCGKGPKAAASTSLARHSLRTAAMFGAGAAGPLEALNTALVVGNGEMCTAVFARMTCDENGITLTLGRAGHPPPVIRRADGSVSSMLLQGSLVGVFPEASFEESEIRLAADDVMVLVTDGVLESRRGDDLFGEERLAGLIADRTSASAQQLADAILAGAEEFHDGRSVDDIAVLVIRATPETFS